MVSSNRGNFYAAKESFNPSDPYAVATSPGVVKSCSWSRAVNYFSRLSSSAFIRRGVASCEVTGARQYSADLSQGGMEVPCKLPSLCL